MNNEQAVNDFSNKVRDSLTKLDFSSIMQNISSVVRSSISRNFAEQGNYGTANPFGGGKRKWKPSVRSKSDKKAQGKTTLLDTGLLRNSIVVHSHQEGNNIKLEVSSNLKYSAIHQFGGTINRNAHSKLYTQNRYKKGGKKGKYKKGTTTGKGATVGAYSIKIPARPYIVLQDEDINEIQTLIAKRLIQSLK